MRAGLYPSLVTFLVFLVAVLITLNYYDVLASLVGVIAPKCSETTQESIGFAATYFLALFILLFSCLWFCSDRLHLGSVVDGVGGGILGAATGIVCSGSLMMLWFAMPFTTGELGVDDVEMFFPSHSITLKLVTFVGNRIPGDKEFHGDRFLRDRRYGLPAFGSVGSGVYVSSIPTGLRVFSQDSQRREVAEFFDELKKAMGRGDEDLRPSERRERPMYRGRTPLFIQGAGAKTHVAVIMDSVGSDVGLGTDDAAGIFVNDGEVAVARAYGVSKNYAPFIKIYEVEQESGYIGTVIALFQPKDPTLWDEVDDLLPLKKCFVFDSNKVATDLASKGATPSDIRRGDEEGPLLRRLRYGGKAYFEGLGRQPYVVEITGPRQYKISKVEKPKDLSSGSKEREREKGEAGSRREERGPTTAAEMEAQGNAE